MRRGAWLVVALTAVSLVVAAWITTSSPTPVFTNPPRARSTQPTPTEAQPEQAAPDTQKAEGARSADLPLSIVIVFYVLMTILALALLFVIISRAQARRRRGRSPADPGEPIDVETLSEEALPAALAAAVGARLTTMGTGTPRNAIVRCWVDLEETGGAAGLSRDPALTAVEFTRAVLARYAVDSAAIVALADLYREARFSEHDLTEDHRARATAALESLQAQLRRPAHAEPT